jgi:choline dehydrogenase-like flavoprotein
MIDSKKFDFDAIVVGSGISGGWAAKELTEKGLKVLVLERGKPMEAGSGYLGEHAPNWKLPFQGKKPRELYETQYPVQSKVTHSFNEATRQFWNNDMENPYAMDEGKPFLWARSDVVGGRSLIWGRQTYRLSEQDFEANATDGHGIPWPVGYKDIAPWYSYVEKFAGINGKKEGLPQLPDSEFQKPMPWFAIEETIHERLKKKAPDVTLTNGRVAILTEDLPGRKACHYCGPCARGCSTGSYFSSQSSTLPAAQATGNLTLRANSVVDRLEYDSESGKISRVHVIDAETKERLSFTAKIFFLCASTVGSTQILLNSASEDFPDGLANSSGVLGRFMMESDYFWIIWTVIITVTDLPVYTSPVLETLKVRMMTSILCAATAIKPSHSGRTGKLTTTAKVLVRLLRILCASPDPGFLHWQVLLSVFHGNRTECT